MEFNENSKIPKKYLGHKRPDEDCLSKETIAMATAMGQALMSRDPSTQVGACIVDEDGNIMSCGHNTPPRGWNEDEFTWDKPEEEQYNKYTYIIHAEMNALFNYKGSIKDFEGSTLYVTFLPCPHCAKHMVQAGIKNVVYLTENNSNVLTRLSSAISKFIFKKCGVDYKKYEELDRDNINLLLFRMKTEDSQDLAFFEKKKSLGLKKDNN